MVSSQISVVTRSIVQKFSKEKLILPTGVLDTQPLENEEFDFSDVFGPVSVQTSIEANGLASENCIPASYSTENVYDDPIVVFNGSHSLVGPTIRVTQTLPLSKLTLHGTDSSLELLECAYDKVEGEQKELSMYTAEEHVTKYENGVVGLDDFEILKVVGQGAFGKVFQVKKKCTSEIYAMKVMRKDKIIERNHAEHMKAERDILTKIGHPFIVQLRYSFQTKYRLYLVMDFINGGHLFFQLYHHGFFREDLARIYAAEIVSAVSHLHANGIMHRDLKPENILLDADGHAILTDFSLAKEFKENTRSNSLCGTIEYMAPEIILAKGHDKAADWWSVGILLFEMLTGKPPIVFGNRDKFQQKIVKGKIELPAYLSSDAHSLLQGLLQREPSERLGSGPAGSNEIKSHKWFKPINWTKLDAREVQPSFRPTVAGKNCVANFEERWTNMPLLDSPVSSPVAGDSKFMGFTYVRPSPFLEKPPSSLP